MVGQARHGTGIPIAARQHWCILALPDVAIAIIGLAVGGLVDGVVDPTVEFAADALVA